MRRERRGRRNDRLTPVEALLGRVMPPQFADRSKLDRVAADWTRVVGPLLGKQSTPLDIVDGELLVTADTPLIANRLTMMGGNIARVLMEQWRLEVRKVKVVVGRAPLKRTAASGPPRPVHVSVREEDVLALKRHVEEQTPELPDDAVDSLARLRAFFARRFPQGRSP